MPRYQRPHVEARIRHTLGQMPYGTFSRISAVADRVGLDGLDPAPITLEAIADYLEALRDQLVAEVADETKRKTEHDQLKADVEAMRRVLGGTRKRRERRDRVIRMGHIYYADVCDGRVQTTPHQHEAAHFVAGSRELAMALKNANTMLNDTEEVTDTIAVMRLKPRKED